MSDIGVPTPAALRPPATTTASDPTRFGRVEADGTVILLAPDFYGEVIDEPFIRNGLIGRCMWMAMGNLVMRKMIDMRI